MARAPSPLPTIYFGAHESKDVACLRPLVEPLEGLGIECRWVDMSWQGIAEGPREELAEFVVASRPKLVTASAISPQLARILNKSGFVTCVALEHGIAPYKVYSWSRQMLDADLVYATSPLIGKRLVSLYGNEDNRFQGIMFPRLGALKQALEERRSTTAQSAVGRAQRDRPKLLLFSWGVSEAAVVRMAQNDDVTVLLHPADGSRLRNIVDSLNNVFISDTITTPSLLASCAVVFGDHSSLTLEAVTLGIPTYMFLAQELYSADLDLPPEFMNPESSHVGEIYKSGRIPRQSILDQSELLEALDRPLDELLVAGDICVGDRIVGRLDQTKLPEGILPAEEQLDPSACARMLLEAVMSLADDVVPSDDSPSDDDGFFGRLNALTAIYDAYQAILHRNPDLNGLRHYLPMLEQLEPTDVKALGAFWSHLIESKEADGKWKEAHSLRFPSLRSRISRSRGSAALAGDM